MNKYVNVNDIAKALNLSNSQLRLINSMPTDDVIKVIRCKNCKFYDDSFKDCMAGDNYVKTTKDGYCDSAEEI